MLATLDAQTAYTRLLNHEAAHSKRYGYGRGQRYARAWAYYTGANAPPDNTRQPLGINLVKTICDKHSGYVWGQWRDDVVGVRVQPDAEAPDQEAEVARCDSASAFLRKLLFRQNDGNIVLPEVSLNAGIYGDGFLKLSWDPFAQGGDGAVVLTSVKPEHVFLRPHPHDKNSLLEAIVAYPIDRNDAFELYGTRGNPTWSPTGRPQPFASGTGTYWERWTVWTYETWIDDVAIPAHTGANPTSRVQDGLPQPGVIPLVHVPNLNAGGELFGFSDSEPVMMAIDELNRKLADEGDVINNHAHPTVLLSRYFGSIADLPVGPDVIWDMGREGEAKLLEWSGPSPRTHEYLELIASLIQDMASLPPAAFGRASQSQLSGVAAQMAMLPLTERAGAKRVIWTRAFKHLGRIIAAMLRAHPLPGVEPKLFEDHVLQTQWSPVLPKDQAENVDQTIALYTAGLLTTKDALVRLDEDDVAAKTEAIMKERTEMVALGLLPSGGPAGGGAQTGVDVEKPGESTPSTPAQKQQTSTPATARAPGNNGRARPPDD
jgi:hypothetical protein